MDPQQQQHQQQQQQQHQQQQQPQQPSPGAEGLGPELAERIHFTVGAIALREAADAGRTIDRSAVQALTQACVNWTCGVHAVDVEAFARHRAAPSVGPADVKLAVRRLEADEHLEDFERALSE